MNLTDNDIKDLIEAALGECIGRSGRVKEACRTLTSTTGEDVLRAGAHFSLGPSDSIENQAAWARGALARPGISDKCREVLLQFLAYLSL